MPRCVSGETAARAHFRSGFYPYAPILTSIWQNCLTESNNLLITNEKWALFHTLDGVSEIKTQPHLHGGVVTAEQNEIALLVLVEDIDQQLAIFR